MRCQSHHANNFWKTKKPFGGFVPLVLPRAAARFPFLGEVRCLSIFGSSAKRSCSTRQAAGMVAHGCPRARGVTPQGDRLPKRGLGPCHSSPKPCQKPHPRQPCHKQPELAAFGSNQSNSPLLCSKLPAQGSALKVQPCLHGSFPLSARRENEEFNRVSSYCLPLDFRLRAGDVSGCFCEAGAEEW